MSLWKSLFGAAAVCALLAATGARADIKTDTVRQRAEQACYDDVQKLCPDDVPDEQKIAACMGRQRASLSSQCRSIYDKGMH